MCCNLLWLIAIQSDWLWFILFGCNLSWCIAIHPGALWSVFVHYMWCWSVVIHFILSQSVKIKIWCVVISLGLFCFNWGWSILFESVYSVLIHLCSLPVYSSPCWTIAICFILFYSGSFISFMCILYCLNQSPISVCLVPSCSICIYCNLFWSDSSWIRHFAFYLLPASVCLIFFIFCSFWHMEIEVAWGSLSRMEVSWLSFLGWPSLG